MKLLAHVHKYPPEHNAGAEWMLHASLKWLVARGHEARVLIPGVPHVTPYTLDGVTVTGGRVDPEAYEWADVVLTHLDLTATVMRECRNIGRPLVHLVHNDKQLGYHRVRSEVAALVVFNSEWLARTVKWRGPSIVVRPPVFADDYRTGRAWDVGDCITLVNVSKAKGAAVFWALADDERNAHRKFLAVRGAYGIQEIPRTIPPNVEVWENRPDARAIYRATRVLLMPSGYESWGRCAVEAAANGIPTVGAPTPGLVEAMGPALICAVPSNVADYQWALETLDDPQRYAQAQRLVLARSAQLDPTPDLERLEAALTTAARRRPSPRRGQSRGSVRARA